MGSFNYCDDRPVMGQIVQQDGKNWKVTKVTTTAIAVERYFWWDRLYDRYARRETS